MLRALSKRTQLSAHLRQSFIVAGVFLVTGLIVPHKTYALTPAFNPPKTVVSISPLDDNNKQIDDLKAAFEFKKSLIEKKSVELQEQQAKVQEVVDTKQSLQDQVQDMKAQVADLQAKVAEKKRLEALRIVPPSAYAANADGNLYALGNCTWYVKSRRPDLPNDLGNANTWFYNAAAQGWKTGVMAKTGAVGVTEGGWLGHVVYVEKWLGDGQILISEMNYAGLYSQRTRVANESDFHYIYEKPL